MADHLPVPNNTDELREMERLYSAHNYDPLDVVVI